MSKKATGNQADLNIGLIGHVDHGKSTLVEALSGVFPDTHSEEIKKGISIRLGYAGCEFRKCPDCPEPEAYTTQKKCPKCGKESVLLRRVSFVDAPGHEVFMATMLSGASLLDGAILVIAANEKCPMPQTREHLAAMQIVGMEHLIVAQNKIELVSDEQAKENYYDIKNFMEKEMSNEVPIIPISAAHKTNVDVLIQTIEQNIPNPKLDSALPARMLVARSFDINRPGSKPENWKGGVVGGSITQGTFKVGEEIEIRPGIRKANAWTPIITEITSMKTDFGYLEEAKPGGLIGIGTLLDPALTKGDRLVGNMVGKPGELPPIYNEIIIEVDLLSRVVGSKEEKKINRIETGEILLIVVGTARTLGTVEGKKGKKDYQLNLRIPISAELGTRMAISRNINNRYRLIGWAVLKDGS
ncbi:MAG: translation initiation factor IF-2 subunit gamma [Candidatus Hodarchaeota archaeon]